MCVCVVRVLVNTLSECFTRTVSCSSVVRHELVMAHTRMSHVQRVNEHLPTAPTPCHTRV